MVFYCAFCSLVTGAEARGQSLTGGGVWQCVLCPVGVVTVLISLHLMRASSARAGRGRFWRWGDGAWPGSMPGVLRWGGLMEARTEQAWISVLEKEAKSHTGQLGSGLGNPTALAEAEALSGLRQAGKGVEEEGTQIMSPQTVPPCNSNSVDR